MVVAWAFPSFLLPAKPTHTSAPTAAGFTSRARTWRMGHCSPPARARRKRSEPPHHPGTVEAQESIWRCRE